MGLLERCTTLAELTDVHAPASSASDAAAAPAAAASSPALAATAASASVEIARGAYHADGLARADEVVPFFS
jgi:hypothetical protein